MQSPIFKMNFDYDVPMFDAQFVNLEQGTGIVHCAPSHGPDDFNLCLKNNIPLNIQLMMLDFIQRKFHILKILAHF